MIPFHLNRNKNKRAVYGNDNKEAKHQPDLKKLNDNGIVTCYAIEEEFSSPRIAHAFANGCGGEVTYQNELYPGAVAMFGSPKRWDLLKGAMASGRVWYYADHGYFDRGDYYRITKNDFQFRKPGRANYKRLKRLCVDIKRWNKRGDKIIICPPEGGFAKLMGFDAVIWKKSILQTLSFFTKRGIIIRERKDFTEPLAVVLKEAWALVTYNSNSAVEALIAGVPVFCTGPTAAAPLALKDLAKIEDPFYPKNRQEWAATLANNQWTMKEINDGLCWRQIK